MFSVTVCKRSQEVKRELERSLFQYSYILLDGVVWRSANKITNDLPLPSLGSNCVV